MTGVPSSYSRTFPLHYDSGNCFPNTSRQQATSDHLVRLSDRQQDENLRAFCRAGEELLSSSPPRRGPSFSSENKAGVNSTDKGHHQQRLLEPRRPGPSAPPSGALAVSGGPAAQRAAAARTAPLRRDSAALRKTLTPQGLKKIESADFSIFVFETLSKMRFVLISDVGFETGRAESIFARTYQLFADYVQKDCFLSTEMPFRSELFEMGLQGIIPWGA